MIKSGNLNRRLLAIIILSAVGIAGTLIGATIILLYRRDSDRLSGPAAQKLQHELQIEARNILPPVGDVAVRHGALPGLVTTYYKSDLNYEAIRANYRSVLEAQGWRFLREEQVKYDGNDYGGKQFIYCKAGYAADVQYAGRQESQFGWTYAFALSTGLFNECK